MQNKLTVSKPIEGFNGVWEIAVDNSNGVQNIAKVYGMTENQCKERANLIVDAFNNAGLGPFLP